MSNYKHTYLITSERAFSDEDENSIRTNKDYSIGDTVVLDGINWRVVQKVN